MRRTCDTISRRAFLRAIAQLPVLITSLRVHWPTGVIAQSSPLTRAYGAGAYGRGTYTGCRHVYLPLVKKEGS
jgi:hypothetical protein